MRTVIFIAAAASYLAAAPADAAAPSDSSAADALERDCRARKMEACVALADQLLPDRDPARGFSLLTDACDHGEPKGCNMLGVLYQEGRGATADLDQAARLYEKACSQRDGWGCNNLGKLYQTGKGKPMDPARAAPLFTQACDLGNAEGCNRLGVLYDTGGGVPKDPQRAAGLYQKACDAKGGWGCHNLGLCYSNGSGVPADKGRALTLFSKACDLRLVEGCRALADARASQAPPPPAPVAATAAPAPSTAKAADPFPAKTRLAVELGGGYPLMAGEGKDGNTFRGSFVFATRLALSEVPYQVPGSGLQLWWDWQYSRPAQNILLDSKRDVIFSSHLFGISWLPHLGGRAHLELGAALGGSSLWFTSTGGGAEVDFIWALRVGALLPFAHGKSTVFYVHPAYVLLHQGTKQLGGFWFNNFILTVGVGL